MQKDSLIEDLLAVVKRAEQSAPVPASDNRETPLSSRTHLSKNSPTNSKKA